MIPSSFSDADANRALRTLRKLARHEISKWALTGGLAVEIHCQIRRCAPSVRPFNDLDFVTSGFDCIPTSLAGHYLFNHIHPLDPPGKTILLPLIPEALRVLDSIQPEQVTRSLEPVWSSLTTLGFAGLRVSTG